MSKTGGIAYLIKHGRAPMPTVTRTPMQGKRYATGGDALDSAPTAATRAPINNSLGYGPEYDYVFIPGSMTLDAKGKPVYQSGHFERKTQPAATAAAAAVAQDPYARGSGSSSKEGSGGVADVYGGMNSGSNPNWNATNQALDNAKTLTDAVTKKYGLSESNSNMLAKALGLDTNADTAAKLDALGTLQNTGYSVAGGMDPATAMQARIAAAADPQSDPYEAARQEAETRFTSQEQTTPVSTNPFSGITGYNANGFNTPSSNDSSDSSDSGSRNNNARGGVIRMATGGIGALPAHGGFVGSYAHGGRMLRGPGDGLSDNIPATIGNKQPARLADGEFVVSADVVSALGGGSTEAGSKKLYAMMDRIRKAAHGSKKQVKPVKEHKVLPA